MNRTIRLADYRWQKKKHRKARVTFDRQELRQLLDVYSRRVAAGEWRDYAIDLRHGIAVFSVFRHSFDAPLFAIAKRGDGRHCDYLVYSGPQQLKRAGSIAEVLTVFERHPRLIS